MIRRLFRRLRKTSTQHLNSRDAYARWSQDYPPTPHNRLMQIEQESMLNMMPPLRGQRVLDLACGTGRYGLIALEQGARLVLGVDDSLDMLRRSPLKCRAQASMAHIPLQDGSVDVVICGLAVGHYPELSTVFAEMARVLDTGGQAIVSDFHPFQYLAGARRTFTYDEVTYEVEHYPHLYRTIQMAATKSGLVLESIQEPTLAGQSAPVVIVYRLRKS